MYVSPCAAHYYRQQFEGLDRPALEEQRRLLREALVAVEEQRAEIAGMAGGQVAKLRAGLERDSVELGAKLAAVEQLLQATSGIDTGS